MWPATKTWSKLFRFLPSQGRAVPSATILSCRQYGYVHVPQKKIPHILGPGWLWRKCFIVHPCTQTPDPLTKYQWLTKSVVIHDLPEQILSLKAPDDSVLGDFQRRATDFIAFQVCSHPRWLPFTSLEMSSFLQSCLASAWSLGNHYDHLVQSHLTYSRSVKSYWRRNGDNFLCISDPLYILRTTKALGLFHKPDFQAREGTIPPLQYKPSHLGLFEHSIDQILPSGGIQSRSPFPMAHTLFVHDHKSQNVEQLYAHGLMQLFAQTAAEAVQNGFKLDEDLPYPLVNQGVLTDGQAFTFLCFQLNTLDFRKESEESGVNNVFWAGPSLKLYENIHQGEGVEGFNDTCAGLLLKFVLNKPIRQRPRLWGYGKLALSERRLRTDGHQLSPLTDSINV